MPKDLQDNVITLGVNLLLFVIVVGGFVSGAKSVSVVLVVMFALILVNLYNISPQVGRVTAELNKNKRVLLLQRKKIRENEDLLRRQQSVLSDADKKKLSEAAGEAAPGPKESQAEGTLRLEYWEKLEKELGDTPTSVTESTHLTELRNKRKEIENMIELSKQKYHRRLLDEQSFREIVKDYQKKLIELESEISQLEGKKDSAEESG
ncbi:MAG: hypothetical protein V1921_09135 [Candidatus Altiarchaeota archaeon]